MKKIIKKIILLIIILIILICSLYTYKGYKLYETAISEISVENKAQEIKKEKKNYTKISELPQNYINAVIAVEDRRFYVHNGIDIYSISRAVFTNFKKMKLVEGGSTITQQLAKNIYFSQKKELTRKIAEGFMAIEIERCLSKDEIFELYVNTSYFGDGYYCVGDASEGYFDKKPMEMDLYECTLLAGVPNAPSVYAPTKNPDLAKQRQAQVLKKMVKYKYLTQDEANKILNYEE